MDTNVRSAAGPATITWSGRITSAIEPGERLAVRCVDLHWSVIEQAEPASLPWGTVRHRSRSTSTTVPTDLRDARAGCSHGLSDHGDLA